MGVLELSPSEYECVRRRLNTRLGSYLLCSVPVPLLSLSQPHNVTPLRVNTGPFGETIANEHRPVVKASQS